MTDTTQRVQALRELDILDTPAEAAFDRITEMAARLFRVPIACITLLDEDRFFFKSAIGVETGSTPLTKGLCSTTVERGQLSVVEDATVDSLTQNHPLVSQDPHVRFYAGVPLITESGHAVGTLCIMHTESRSLDDIERNTLEELGQLVVDQLEHRRQQRLSETQQRAAQRSQKLESLAQLTGGIAHDFNNCLMAVLGNLSLLQETVGQNPQATQLLGNIQSAAGRATEMAHELLTFAGERTPSLETVMLGPLLKTTTDLVKSGLPRSASLQLRGADADIAVRADATQLRQVLLGLIINAAESYDEPSGLVELQLGRVGDLATISVSDHGCGMDPKTRARVFDPFFSTKTPRRGLGLAIAQRVISDHGGSIELDSSIGSGTRCTITLPCSSIPENVNADPDAPEPELGQAPAGRVLIVDDEPDVRRFLVAAITHLGYEVVEAGDGHEALAMLSSDAPKPDLVLLDTSMPAISGEQTLTLLHEQLPELPAVVMSGHDLPQVRERFKGQHVRQFLQKPFGIKQLRRCLAGIASTK